MQTTALAQANSSRRGLARASDC